MPDQDIQITATEQIEALKILLAQLQGEIIEQRAKAILFVRKLSQAEGRAFAAETELAALRPAPEPVTE